MREKRKTAQRQRVSDLCAVFLFLLLLPYVCSLLLGHDMAEKTKELFSENRDEIKVRVETENGNYMMEMEEYLTGALAAVIPAEYEMEALKAQAVILRTLCVKEMETSETGTAESKCIIRNYPDRRQLEGLWKENYDVNLQRMRTAVEATRGKYISLEGKTAEPAYFRLSAGRSRDGEECLGGGYSFMKSVECPDDSSAADYRQELTISEDQFWDTLDLERRAELSLVRDSAGYVQWVHIGEEQISGEEFRVRFGLNSACFSIDSGDGRVTFTCTGIGHGFGFCQYDANRRAGADMDFETLLKLYFQGIEISSRTV